jgi:hypothetical protein
MKVGITERERALTAPMGTPHPWPLIWVSIGDNRVGFFAGEVCVKPVEPADTLMARRHEMARALRQLATLFEGNER